MIAAFTDDDHDQDLAEILTQEQAESVRRYLVDKHSIQSAGWFKSRKVAAVGFVAYPTNRRSPSTQHPFPTRRNHPVHPSGLTNPWGTSVGSRRHWVPVVISPAAYRGLSSRHRLRTSAEPRNSL